MDAERHARVREIFREAADRPAAERAAFLDEVCAGDAALRDELDRLLAGQSVRTDSLRPAHPAPPPAPTRLGRFRIEREIGAGGMGVVYLARAEGEAAPVAVKVLHPWLLRSARGLERFQREAEAGIVVRDAHVVRTLEAGSEAAEDGSVHHYLVMEYVEGRTLRDLLLQLGRVPETLLREIALQTSRGLHAIHAAGLLHRDLKPENILLSREQQVRIMDLGVAKLLESSVALTTEGQFIGSLAYAAPEQFAGDPLDPAADLYSLGVLLYELAAGANPFRCDEPVAALHAHMELDVAPLMLAEPRITRFFSELVGTLLQKDPARRIRSAAELSILLEEAERSPWWRARERRVRSAEIPVARDRLLRGRAAELTALHAAWKKAATGSGGVLLLTGEEGMGKSRLLAEWLDVIDPAPMSVLYGAFPVGGRTAGLDDALRDHVGHRDPTSFLERHIPAAPLRARLLERIAPGTATEAPQGDLETAFVQLMRGLAAERPVLWVADDVHFAGEEARRVLAAMARATHGGRVLLVLAGRSDPVHALAATIGGGAAPREIALQGLAEAEMAGLIEDAIGNRAVAERLAPEVAERSDGVPFIAIEILRALGEQGIVGPDREGHPALLRPLAKLEIPPALRDLVARRVSGLAPQARRVLDAAAVCGTTFDASLVAEVLQQPVLQVLQELAEVERAQGIVRSAGRLYRFDHHLLAEALHDALPAALREELHALVAEALLLRAQGAPGSSGAVAVVSHHLRGNRPQAALPWLESALLGLEGRPEARAEVAARALASPSLLPARQRVDMLLVLAGALDVLARRDEQVRACEEALALARSIGDDRRAGLALLAQSGAEFGRNRPDRSLEVLAQLLELAGKLDDSDLELRARLNRGTSLGRVGRRAEAREELARARDLAHAAGDARLEAVARFNDGLQAKDSGATEEAEREYQESLRLAEASGDRRVLSYAHGNLGLLFADGGRYEEALFHIEEQLRLARETGDVRSESIAISNRGLVAISQGHLAAARDDYERHLELARLAGEARGGIVARISLGEIARILGEPRKAEACFGKAGELIDSTGVDEMRGRLFAFRSELAVQQHDIEKAMHLACDAIRIGQRGEPQTIWHGQVALGAAKLAAGEQEEARAAFRAAHAIALEFGFPALLLRPAVALALLDGDIDAAEQALRDLGPRAALVQRMETAYDLWVATRDPAHLELARAQLDELRRRAPADVSATEFDSVPLYRAIDAAR